MKNSRSEPWKRAQSKGIGKPAVVAKGLSHQQQQQKKAGPIAGVQIPAGVEIFSTFFRDGELRAAVSYFCSVDVSRDRIVWLREGTGLGTTFIR